MRANGNCHRTNSKPPASHSRLGPVVHSHALCRAQETGQDVTLSCRRGCRLLRLRAIS